MIRRLLVLALTILCFSRTAAAAGQCSIDVINHASYGKILEYLLISENDVRLYKKIFRAIEAGDFEKADKLTEDLSNHILLGTVLSEKYLHKDYVSNYAELKDWLEKYGDLPDARRIYNLAVRKGGAQGLSKPEGQQEQSLINGWKNEDIAHLSQASKRYLQLQVTKFRRALNQGKTRRARLILEQKRFRMEAPDKYWDELAASLALKYFVDGYNKLAWQWGVRASRRGTSGTAPWVAGLAAWKMKNYKNAAAYFAKLARSGNPDQWLVSAGGYWAHRAYGRLGNKAKAAEMLRAAARYKHTFYGILAAYKSGQPLQYNWDAVAYLNNFNGQEYIYELLASPSIRRAIILIHAKRPDLAERELRFGFNGMNRKQQEATIYIANQYQMHALAIYACNNTVKEPGESYDGVAYPIPLWIPDSGWKVDKALVLALIRQESGFKPEAKSPAGARGLMQLMPNTAYHITKDAGIKKDKNRLLDAEYNLNLGQRYIDYLMAKPFIEGNLFYMAAAYNAGPGNLVKWQKTVRGGDDPLMFIEAIPSAETRIYIERVIANYWIYNMRFGLSNPTLQQVAEGKWPVLERP